jgi:type IV pilus assembly protein PilO
MALIPEEPNKRNAVIAGVLIVGAFYFFNSYWWSEKKTEITDMETHLETLTSQNDRARIQSLRGGAELEERLALYMRHLAELEALIPESTEVPGLLNDITNETLRTRVLLAGIRPQDEEPGPFYTKQSFELEVIGDYHNVGELIAGIASLPRIITPTELDIQEFAGAPAQTRDMEAPLLARFRIETYVVPDRPAAQPQSGQQPPNLPGGDR